VREAIERIHTVLRVATLLLGLSWSQRSTDFT
jgi:hypothetical protein